MMNLTTQTFIANTTYGVPSGNYDGSSQDFLSNVVQAASYYYGQGSVQTINITTTNFTGNINLRASLNDPLTQAVFFDVANTGNLSNVTATTSITATGNFVWMVAQIKDFTAGTINIATITY